LATDAELLNEAWLAADVQDLIARLISHTRPTIYWLKLERLRRAFYFIGNLNAGADIVKTFASRQ